MVKEYIMSESEKDAGHMFRSNEGEPESLKLYMTTTLQAQKAIEVPKVLQKDHYKEKRNKRNIKNTDLSSFISDITRYYPQEEIKNENTFMSKLQVIESKLWV
jgi:hypothetical protein